MIIHISHICAMVLVSILIFVFIIDFCRCPLGGCSNEKPIELTDLEENRELRRYIERKNRQAVVLKKER